ncbi:MAG: phospholipase D family protein, partial [Alicyclobacillaceae bacterium]|nr:phospholipase D family protein [Alicyclobacillaceae bacterium]
MRKFAFLNLILGASLLAGCGTAALPSDHTASTQTAAGAPTQIDWAFTRAGQHPEKKLEDVIGSAKQSLDIAIYSLTKPDIVKAIEQAKKRGVAVRIITDQQEAQNRTQQEALKILKNAGIPIKVNTHKGLMHLKVTIADKAVVTTGSFNYTTAASTDNDEVLVVIRDPAMAQAWDGEFERMWNDSEG